MYILVNVYMYTRGMYVSKRRSGGYIYDIYTQPEWPTRSYLCMYWGICGIFVVLYVLSVRFSFLNLHSVAIKLPIFPILDFVTLFFPTFLSLPLSYVTRKISTKCDDWDPWSSTTKSLLLLLSLVDLNLTCAGF